MRNVERHLELAPHLSEKKAEAPEVSQRRQHFSRKLQPYVLIGGMAALAAPTLGCTDPAKGYENIGSVQQNVWMGNNSPSFGQVSGNTSPSVHFVNAMDGTAVFSSNKAGSQRDIYCSTTANGGSTWSAEQLVSVSAGLEVNDPTYNEVGVTICADNVNCPTPKLIFSSSRSGNSIDVYWADFNLSNCEASNVAPVGGDINQAFIANDYLSVDNSNGKMYYLRTGVVYKTDVGTWIKSQVPGVSTTLHAGIGINGSHLYVSAPDCPNGQGDLDLCRYDFDGTTASNPLNLNDIPSSDALNNNQIQATPFLGSNGDLWYADGAASNTKIVRKLAVGQGGSGGAGGAGGQGGMAGTGGSGGSTGGTGGMGGSPTGGAGGTGGSGYECPVTFEVNSGSCEVTQCDGGNIEMNINNANCELRYQPQGYSTPTTVMISSSGADTMQITGENGGTLFVRYGIDADLDHPEGAAELNVAYIAENNSNVGLGLLGTKFACASLPEENEYNIAKGLACAIDEGAIMVSLNTIPYQALDFGEGAGVVPAGQSFVLDLEDAELIASSAKKPDGGPGLNPDPPDDGCSVCTMGPGATQENTNQQILALLGLVGLTTLRRRRRRKM